MLPGMRRGLAAAILACAACGSSNGSPTDGAVATPDGALGDAALVGPSGPYPIVLAHGLFRVQEHRPARLLVWHPAGAPGAGPDRSTSRRWIRCRARPSAAHSSSRNIQSVLASTGASKVVIIGHSQGGMDARWAASNDPDQVAAVITVATPHRGSPVADVAAGLLPGDSDAALDALADVFGLSGTSFEGVLGEMTTAGSVAFNAATPDAPGVKYWSVAGRSNLSGADQCPPSSTITREWDGSVDTMKAVLSPVAAILSLAALPATPVHDGLVTLDSAQWGTFLGCVPADHFDEVCQIAGQSPGIANSFECLQLYGNLGTMLTNAGY